MTLTLCPNILDSNCSMQVIKTCEQEIIESLPWSTLFYQDLSAGYTLPATFLSGYVTHSFGPHFSHPYLFTLLLQVLVLPLTDLTKAQNISPISADFLKELFVILGENIYESQIKQPNQTNKMPNIICKQKSQLAWFHKKIR